MSDEELYTNNKEKEKEKEKEKDNNQDYNPEHNGITLELGDIIEIHAPSNTELHENTFFITYLDDIKIRLANISSFHPYVLKLDDNGRITDESIHKIILLSRSPELGYARQHLLLPKTWVDIHFGGEVPTIITGEITNLEEDMIEITTFPDIETIYIDFEYKGIPETIPLKQIIIRTKPASLNKIASLLDIRDQMEEGEEFEPGELLDDASSMEYNETGEAIIKIPKDVRSDRSVRDNLHTMYAAASSIIYGEELEDLVQRVELPEHQKRFGIDTQTNDMLDELLSEIPNSKRTKAVMDNIHHLIERYRELREQFSKMDKNGNIFDAKTLGANHKPLVNRMLALNAKLKWLIPVVALRRKMYVSPYPVDDIIQLTDAILGEDERNQQEYLKNRMKGDILAYTAYYEKINQSMTPFEAPLTPNNYMDPQQSVATQLECIVKNMEDFYSTSVRAYVHGTSEYISSRFVIQKYDLGHTKLSASLRPSSISKAGRRVFLREQMTPNDKLTMASMMVMPGPVMQFSKIDLPGSSILTKSELAQKYMYLFRLLRKKTEVQSRAIDRFIDNNNNNNNNEKDKWYNDTWGEEAEKLGYLKQFQEFILDETLEQDPQRYQKFLETMVPPTNIVIKMLAKTQPYQLSLNRIAHLLEPFLVYSQDLTYYQFNDIRYLIKNGIKEYRTNFAKKGDEMASIRSAFYQDATPGSNRMERLLLEKRELFDALVDAYKIRVDMRGRDVKSKSQQDYSKTATSSSEWLVQIFKTDDARLFSSLIQYMMVSLVMPDNLAKALEGQVVKAVDHDEMSKNEKIKATDCARKSMTKRYSSLKELQKDNGEDDVFYDTEFDDTPYGLIKPYEADQKKYSSEDFVDFLAENLIQKHDCPPKMAKELAATLIAKKKRVHPGEYAVLELRPHLPPSENKSLTELSNKEQRSLENESEIKKQIVYYRRVAKHWVHDDSVDEVAFIDSNTMFCNMNKICFKDMKTNICEPIKDAEARMRQIARKKMLGEFDSRFAESVENLQDELKEQIVMDMKRVKKIRRLREVMRDSANNVAVSMAETYKAVDIIQSPYVGLRDQILGQEDFVKRQVDLVKFVELYCRDPMIDELGESRYWLYCTQTNTPLLPSFLFELARTFTSGANYEQRQKELCRSQGILSDDGDSLVDRFSGYVIRKIDLVQEEGYDEAGYKIITSDVMEKDAGLAFIEAAAAAAAATSANATAGKKRVFENETAELVFAIYSAISHKIGLPLDSVEDFVIRVSLELISKNVDNETIYNDQSEKIEKDTGKRRIPYAAYFHQIVLMIVSAVVLVSIQTAIPSFKIYKTFPGCVQSFSGYPEGGGGSVEDTTGLKYFACVLNTLKTTFSPWNSIKKMPLEVIQTRLQSVIQQTIIPRIDLMDLYSKKREYMLDQPVDIPEEHAIKNWTGFLPPVIEFSVVKHLRGLSNDYKEELLKSMRNGSSDQRNQISTFKMKSVLFGYGIIESIRNIVRSKDLILKTASNMFFMENACCNDRNTTLAIDYFKTEDITLDAHIKMVRGWNDLLDSVNRLSKASMFFDPHPTGIVYPSIPSDHYEVNVYAAFIYYCNLDRDKPIPEKMRAIFPDKLAEYDPTWLMIEKIEFFKRHGKPLSLGNLDQLMKIVNNENKVNMDTDKLRGNSVSAMGELLTYLDSRDEKLHKPAIKPRLRELLSIVLEKFNPKTMISETSEGMKRLNNYLTDENEELLEKISAFLQKFGKMSSSTFNQMSELLANIHMWNLDNSANNNGLLSETDETSMYTVIQFMKNSVYAMSRLYPEMIRNNHSSNTKAFSHWAFASSHNGDISNMLSTYYQQLDKFKGDKIITELLEEVQLQLVDLILFLQNIPAFTPIHKDATKTPSGDPVPARTYNLLFSKRTLYKLYTFIWYSVLDEYIQAANDPDMLQVDIHERKVSRRHTIAENDDPMTLGQSSENYGDISRGDDIETVAETGNKLKDMQVEAGDQIVLQERVAQLLVAYLTIDLNGKKMIDLSYSDLNKRVNSSKQKEKKTITDFLRNLNTDERKVENMQKQLKLGRWNVGMRKGLVNYDKERYDEERAEFIHKVMGRTNLDDEEADIPIRITVDDMEKRTEEETEEFYDQEANDIRGLGENYDDGEYYEEDKADDGFGEE